MSVKYASGRTLASTPLVGGNEFPPNLDSAPLRGSWVIAPDGTMVYSDGSDWYANEPQGSEVLIPPWVPVPDGWFQINIDLDGALANRKLISNKFNISYVFSDAETWPIVTPPAMYFDAAGTTPVLTAPESVGLLESSVTPQINWFQDVTVDRPTWIEITRTIGGVEKTVDAISFDGLGQQFKVDFPTTVNGSMVHFTSAGPYIIGVEIPAGVYEFGRYHDWADLEEVILLDRFLTSGEASEIISEIGKQRDRLTKLSLPSDMADLFRDRTEFRSIGSFDFTGVTGMTRTFQNSAAEEWLSGSFLDTAVDVTSFIRTFRSNNLTSIPDGLFDNTPNLSSLSGAFRDNSLTSLPAGLFDNTPNLSNLVETFRSNNLTSLPAGLFDNTPNLSSLSSTFHTNSITSIPNGFLDNVPNISSFDFAFKNNNISSVPDGLFDTQTVARNYAQCFDNNSLNSENVDRILISIQYSADQNNLNNGSIGLDGNSGPGQAGRDATDALRARGWAVTVIGY